MTENRIFLALLVSMALGCAAVTPTSSIPVTTSLLTERCDSGEGWACTRIGHLQETDGELEAAERSFRRGCTLGSAWGCDEAGQFAEARSNLAEALALFTVACEGGDAGGCFHRGRRLAYNGGLRSGAPTTSAALAAFHTACDGGHLGACERLLEANLSEDEGALSPTTRPEAERLCDLGSTRACLVLAAAAEDDLDRFVDRAVRAAVLTCERRGPGPCVEDATVLRSFAEDRDWLADIEAPRWSDDRASLHFLTLCGAAAGFDDDPGGPQVHAHDAADRERISDTCTEFAREVLQSPSVPQAARGVAAAAYVLCGANVRPAATCALAGALDLREVRGATRSAHGLATLAAACQSNGFACTLLVMAYRDGIGPRPNAVMAAQALVDACDVGSSAACDELFRAYDEAWFPDEARGAASRLLCAYDEVETCLTACRTGHEPSCTRLIAATRAEAIELSASDADEVYGAMLAHDRGGRYVDSLTLAAAALHILRRDPDGDTSRPRELLERGCVSISDDTHHRTCTEGRDALSARGVRLDEVDFHLAVFACESTEDCDRTVELGAEYCAGENAGAAGCWSYFNLLHTLRPDATILARLRDACDATDVEAACDAFQWQFLEAGEPAAFVDAYVVSVAFRGAADDGSYYGDAHPPCRRVERALALATRGRGTSPSILARLRAWRADTCE